MLYGVPLSWTSLQRQETLQENAAAVTVLSGATNILGATALVWTVGDRLRVRFIVRATKGLTAGDVTLEVIQVSGTASVFWIQDAFAPRWRLNAVPASAVWEISGEISGEVVASGSAELRLRGTSAGSNSTIAIDEAKFAWEEMFG